MKFSSFILFADVNLENFFHNDFLFVQVYWNESKCKWSVAVRVLWCMLVLCIRQCGDNMLVWE